MIGVYVHFNMTVTLIGLYGVSPSIDFVDIAQVVDNAGS